MKLFVQRLVHIVNGPQHPFSEVLFLITIAQFYRFMCAG